MTHSVFSLGDVIAIGAACFAVGAVATILFFVWVFTEHPAHQRRREFVRENTEDEPRHLRLA